MCVYSFFLSVLHDKGNFFIRFVPQRIACLLYKSTPIVVRMVYEIYQKSFDEKK